MAFTILLCVVQNCPKSDLFCILYRIQQRVLQVPFKGSIHFRILSDEITNQKHQGRISKCPKAPYRITFPIDRSCFTSSSKPQRPESLHQLCSGGEAPAPRPDPPIYMGSSRPPHAPRHFLSASGRRIYRRVNKHPIKKPINREAGGRQKMMGAWGEGGLPT